MFDREYTFYGKHADMVKRLTGKLSDSIGRGVFRYNYDVYQIAPFVGFLYNQKGKLDKATGQTTKIFRDKMMDGRDELIFNYRNLMMMIYKDLPSEERMNIAFRLDDKEEERKQYDAVYEEYVLGGVEKIYEKIFVDASTVDDYLMNLYEFLAEFQQRYYEKVEAN